VAVEADSERVGIQNSKRKIQNADTQRSEGFFNGKGLRNAETQRHKKHFEF
jgi:hypothetical protein